MKNLFIAILLAAGCNQDPAIVDLTIGLDPAIPRATLDRVHSLTVDVSGLETATVSDPVATPFSTGEERLIVTSIASGFVTLTVTGRDASGAPLIAGHISFNLNVGTVAKQRVTLFAYVPPGDGGMAIGDMAHLDMASGGSDMPPPPPDMTTPPPPDMTTTPPPDMAMPPPPDLSTPPDLAPVSCPSTVVFCDDFESGAINPLTWNTDSSGLASSATIDTTQVHSGSFSVHFQTSAVATNGTSAHFLQETQSFAGTGQNIFVRAWYYFSSADNNAVATLMTAGQNAPPHNNTALDIDHQTASIYNGFNANAYTKSAAPTIPLNKWTCLEWEISTGTNQLHVWVNGTAVGTLTLTNQMLNQTPAINELEFGLGVYSSGAAQGALDAWVDDIIVDNSQIGCF
jgi:hypothetical protein